MIIMRETKEPNRWTLAITSSGVEIRHFRRATAAYGGGWYTRDLAWIAWPWRKSRR